MKILPNIIPVARAYNLLRYLTKFKKQIEEGRRTGNKEMEQAGILSATSTWGGQMLRTFKVDLTVNGKENLPAEGPVVYISNHQGYGDIPTLCAVLDTIQYGFIAKENLAKVPLYGEWILRNRGVLMKRDDVRASLRAIEEGVKLINEGFSMLIFPEGTRSKGGPMHEFKNGSLRLATKPGVPIIPITLDGTWHMFEECGYVKSGAKITVTIHSAIPTAGLSKHEQGELTKKVQDIIMSALPEKQRQIITE